MNKNLIAYRKVLNLSQTYMANKLNISLTSYNRKENSKIDFTQSEMIRVIEIFKENKLDVKVDDIFFNNEVNLMVTLQGEY